MTRLELFNLLRSINQEVDIYNIGEKTGVCESPYIVVKYEQQQLSYALSAGGWQYIHLYFYAPIGDFDTLYEISDKVYKALKAHNLIEVTGNISPEFLEVETTSGNSGAVNAIARRLEIRIPKEV